MATKNKIVNIPIFEQDIKDTMRSLPRTLNEAGIIPVQLKRKLEYKNDHRKEYVSVPKLEAALKTLKDMGHPHYEFVDADTFADQLKDRCEKKDHQGFNFLFGQNEPMEVEEDGTIEVNNDDMNISENEKSEENEDNEEEKKEAEYQEEDQIQKYKFDFNAASAFLDQHAELDVREDVQEVIEADVQEEIEAVNQTTAVAPGEGHIPTNILRETDWDIKSFPGLHPDGKHGLDYKRDVKLTMQQYFEQRIQNKDGRFAMNPDYVFAAFAACERDRLDKNVNISFQRGRKKENGEYSLDDPYSVLDNTPGTPRYWQKKKYELIARLENLGAFQVFFTLSCADMRWNENFTAFLEDHDITYSVIEGLEECLVAKKGEEPKPLLEFLEKEENKSKYEFIRKNVLTATQNFNHRVQEFIKNIVMAKNGTKMPVLYYNYRVEFQLRGAGHIHGTLWLDLEKLSKVIDIGNPEGREAMDEEEDDKEDRNSNPNKLQEIFDKIKDEKLGVYHETCEDNCEKCTDLATLAWFADRFTTCTLKDPSTRCLAKDVQQHKHFPKSCYKKGRNCKFGAPWFPCLKTIIQVPARIKFKPKCEPDDKITKKSDKKIKEDEAEEKIIQEKIEEATKIQKDVKEVLENTESVKYAEEWRQDEIETFLIHRGLEQKITSLLEQRQNTDWKEFKDHKVLEDYQDNVDRNVSKHEDMLEHKLKERIDYHASEKKKIAVDEIKKDFSLFWMKQVYQGNLLMNRTKNMRRL